MIGVLALQGDFSSHHTKLVELGVKPILVKKASDFKALSGLVIPGGESTTLLRLMDEEFRETLAAFTQSKNAILATCAGCILMANEVSNPSQFSFSAMNISVERNSYGRQTESFVDSNLSWTTKGLQLLENCSLNISSPKTEGVFIRAPKITSIGSNVDVLIEHEETPVFVRQNNVFAATFHPELSEGSTIHELFLKIAEIDLEAR
jgi:5'-phosphate synthase pdxT subunit